MNTELQTAIARIAALPDDEQARLAQWLQSELDDERRWQEQFDADPSMLLMADAAAAEDDRGETRTWPVVDR